MVLNDQKKKFFLPSSTKHCKNTKQYFSNYLQKLAFKKSKGLLQSAFLFFFYVC